MNKAEKIAFIKSYQEPPYNEKDPYYERDPWNKFGGVSSNICMCWRWFKNCLIDAKTTEEDVETAYAEMLSQQNCNGENDGR